MARQGSRGAGATRLVRCPSCGKHNRVPAGVTAGLPHCGSCKKPLPWVVEADDDSFGALTAGALPVLVDLWAPWCAPCRMVAPGVEQASRTYAGRLKVVKVNVDESPRVARRFGIQSIPTLLFLRGGMEVARQLGAVPAPALEQWVGRQLQSLAA